MAFDRLKIGDKVVVCESLAEFSGQRGTIIKMPQAANDDMGPTCLVEFGNLIFHWVHHSRLIKLTPLDLLAEI